jgi:hypothetical protein
VGRFFDSEAPAEISGEPIAFIGDRTRFGKPRPVIPPPDAAWNWKATTVSEDETTWAVHQSEEQNKGKLWSHGGVYLPSIVAKYATEQPRTAWEVHQYLNETVLAEESVVEETEVEKLKVWLLAVGQTVGAKALALGMALVVTMAAVFEEWCFNHINSYLGEKVSNQANQMKQQGSNVMEEVVCMLLRNFEESAKKTESIRRVVEKKMMMKK